jgi:ABC-type antimicrobial peptide transport system permease subunit
MVRGVLFTVATGPAIGLIAAVSAARAASPVLFNVSPTDLETLALVTAVLTLVAITAAGIPARRATRIDPAVALRDR